MKKTNTKKILIICLILSTLLMLSGLLTIIKINHNKRNNNNVNYSYLGAEGYFYTFDINGSSNGEDAILKLPQVKEAYQDDFLGWYTVETGKKVEENDIITEKINIEPRFTGLYKNRQLIKTWGDLVSDKIISVDYNVIEDVKKDISGDLILGAKVVKINYNAFENCKNLTTVTFPEGLLIIENSAFAGCSSLKHVEIPASVILIENGAFKYCPNIERIDISENNMSYDNRNNCNAIIHSKTNTLIAGCKTTVIPETIEEISHDAFAGCLGLQNAIIPEGVKSIGERAFEGCTGLINLSIPSTLSSISDFRPFEGCVNLASIKVDPNNTIYYSGDYNVLIKHEQDYDDMDDSYYTRDALILGCNNSTIPQGVHTIGDSAFRGYPRLTSIVIPASVSSISSNAFYNCDNLTSIVVDTNNSRYDSRDNCNAIIEKSRVVYDEWTGDVIETIPTRLVVGCKTTVIPESVEEIDIYAFRDCKKLENISLPSSIKRLGSGAFKDCINLKSIIIPEGVESLEYGLFEGCINLKSITIPEGVESLENDLFEGCINLTSITIPSSVKEIGDGAFEGCVNLNTIKVSANNTVYTSIDDKYLIEVETKSLKFSCQGYIIPDGVEKIERDAFYGRSDIESIIIPSSVKEIGRCAFEGCKSLTSVIMLDGLEIIGSDAFYGCISLTNVIIPSSVKKIGGRAFGGCVSLTSLTIPASVNEIGESAFAGCVNLSEIIVDEGNLIYDSRENCNAIIEKTRTYEEYGEQITKPTTLIVGCKNTIIPDSVECIGDFAFSGCKGLTDIIIPGCVKKIGYGSFENCTSLKTLTLSEGLEVIFYYAFSGCYGLTSLTIPASVNQISGHSFGECFGIASIVVAQGNEVYDSRDNCNAVIQKSRTYEQYGEQRTEPTELILGCKNTIIPNGVEIIGGYAFYGCKDLTNISIPESVTIIDAYAFVGTNLSSIHLPENVKRAGGDGDGAFSFVPIVIADTNKIYDSYFSQVIDDAKIVYIKSGLDVSEYTDLERNFYKQTISDKEGYDMYIR